jgi:flagellar motor switch protein FliN/FliY
MSADDTANLSRNETNAAGSRPSHPPPGAKLGEPRSDGLDFVMDVPVEVSVEIGRRKMRIAEVLRIGAGSVLELDKIAGEPLDIYVNNRIVARGEAVVVGDHYGVRLTEILIADDGRARSGEHR